MDGWEAARDELVMKIRMKCFVGATEQREPGHTGEQTGVRPQIEQPTCTRQVFKGKKRIHSLDSLHYFISPIRANQVVMD